MASAPKLITETAFKIEKGVPVPASLANGKYPFRAMAVGDSVFVNHDDAASAAVCARQYAHRADKKFVTRAEGAGRRIWRTA